MLFQLLKNILKIAQHCSLECLRLPPTAPDLLDTNNACGEGVNVFYILIYPPPSLSD